MIWDVLVIILIVGFAYAFAFKEDVPPVVTTRALWFFTLVLVLLNIVPILRGLGSVIGRVLGSG